MVRDIRNLCVLTVKMMSATYALAYVLYLFSGDRIAGDAGFWTAAGTIVFGLQLRDYLLRTWRRRRSINPAFRPGSESSAALSQDT